MKSTLRQKWSARAALNKRAFHLQSQGLYGQAIRSFKELLRLEPNNAQLYHQLADLALLQDEWAAAEAYYQQALSLDARLNVTWNNLANLKLRQGKLEEARGCLLEALAVDEEYSDAWVNLGVYHKQLLLIPEAEACFMKALNFNPNHALSNNHLGQLFYDAANYPRALHYFDQALKNTHQASPHYNAALCHIKLQRYVLAVEHLQLALGLQPYWPQTHFQLGECRRHQGSNELAREHYQHAMDYGLDYDRCAELIARSIAEVA